MDSLGTAHSKIGGRTFVTGRVERILKKVVHIYIKNFNSGQGAKETITI